MTFTKATRLYTAELEGREDEFLSWIAAKGGEVRAPTNEWEVARYKKDGVVSIIYRNLKGRYSLLGRSVDDLDAFGRDVRGELSYEEVAKRGNLSPGTIELVTTRYAKVLNMKAPHEHEHPCRTPGPSAGEKTRAKLRKRDGDLCWFCHREMGLDATIEHLRPKAEGGSNRLDNLVLAHTRCNAMAGSWPLEKKHAVAGWLRANPQFFDQFV